MYELEPCIDLSELLKGEDEIITVSIDRGFVNVLVLHAKPQYRSKNGSSAIIKTDFPKDYSFIRLNFQGEILNRIRIKQEFYNYHFCCFISNSEILLVCGRCRYRANSNSDKNARVFDANGELVREFVLGRWN